MQRSRGESPTVQRFINSMTFNALNAVRSEAFEYARQEKNTFSSDDSLMKYITGYMRGYFMNRVPQNRNYNTEITRMEDQILKVLAAYPLDLTESEKSLIDRPASPSPSNSGSIETTESTGSTSSSGLNRIIPWGSNSSNTSAPVIGALKKGGKRKHRTKRLRKHRTKRSNIRNLL